MNQIRPEIETHPLAQAAREVNDYAEKHGLDETCQHYNLKTEDVRYIAEQRALRCIWAFKGVNLNQKKPVMLLLTGEEKLMALKLSTAYMDGLVIGWRANELGRNKNGE